MVVSEFSSGTPVVEMTAEEHRRRAAELEVILAGLAEIRDRVRGRVDAVAVVLEGRQELAQRGLCAGER